MARATRVLEGGLVYHVLNRGNGRRPFLHKPADFDAWLRLLAEANKEVPMRLLAFCLMPNHFHLLLWPQRGEDLSSFVGWLSQIAAAARPSAETASSPSVARAARPLRLTRAGHCSLVSGFRLWFGV